LARLGGRIECRAKWDMMASNRNMKIERPLPAFAARDSLIELLHRWQARKKFGPDAENLLRELSRRIFEGQWCVAAWDEFHIMGQAWREDTHSQILSWLFNPRQAHGLGERFLREFARKATGISLPKGRACEVETNKRIGSGNEKVDIEVRGEGWILAVENKIWHIETPGQTRIYAEHYQKLKDRGQAVFGVFLTRGGELAQARDFFQSMSYGALRKILEKYQTRASTSTAQFIRQFAEHIRRDLEVR